MKIKLSLFAALWLLVANLPASAQSNTWQWESTLIPKALVFKGVWSEMFQFEPALHKAGVQYQSFYMTDLPKVYPDLHKRSVIILINADAPYLEQQQIKDFVFNGGGLVILGGFYTFNCGGFKHGYKDAVLVDTLPVSWPTNINFDIPVTLDGLPLSRASTATWLKPFDASAKPMVYYLHTFIPNPDATVQLMAGDKPAIVSSTFGKGRVVAVGLTVNGITPNGQTPFWEWPEWSSVLAQAIEWAAEGRPPGGVVTPKATATNKPLTKDEIADFAMGMKTPDNLVSRANANPTADTAQALFDHVMSPEGGKMTLAQILPALAPFAKPAWGPKLAERTEASNPNLDDRLAAVQLLGASRWPDATARLLKCLNKPETKLAAIEALGLAGDPSAISSLVQIHDNALRASRLPGQTERFSMEEFTGGNANMATAAAIALYRLGETTGVERVTAMRRRVFLYWRVLHVAGRAHIAHPSPSAIARMQNIWNRTDRMTEALQKLNSHDRPIPASQISAFLKTAASATDPAEVDWIVGEMEVSVSALPPSTWQPLTAAKDGMIARMARAAGSR